MFKLSISITFCVNSQILMDLVEVFKFSKSILSSTVSLLLQNLKLLYYHITNNARVFEKMFFSSIPFDITKRKGSGMCEQTYEKSIQINSPYLYFQ